MTACTTSLPPCPADGIEVYIRQEIPSGNLDCINLTYSTATTFQAGSLEVYLDGRLLDSGLDFFENPGLNGFTVILDPENPQRLNTPFRQNESLRVNYISTAGTGSCITIL